jgi:3,4-dihydroxy-2-butanone 4-phosphate synthase
MTTEPRPHELDSELISRVTRGIEQIRAGKMLILVDDEDRENEGDLVLAADHVTPEAIAFMANYGRGLICVTLTEEQIARLDLPMMAAPGRSGPRLGTAFTVSIEASQGVTTGISAADRAHTIRVAINPNAQPNDVVVPGHVFPLVARHGGVLVRAGQTEGSVDLARLAGSSPAGIVCEIANDDGSMARMPDLERFAEKHDMAILTIADLIAYRLQTEALVSLVAERGGAGELDADDPLVLDALGALVAEAHSVAVLGLRSTTRSVHGAKPGPEASVRKLLGVEHDQRTQELGLSLLGPEGATVVGAAAQWTFGFLANRCLTIAGGTSEIQRNVIGERLLGLPRDPEPTGPATG